MKVSGIKSFVFAHSVSVRRRLSALCLVALTSATALASRPAQGELVPQTDSTGSGQQFGILPVAPSGPVVGLNGFDPNKPLSPLEGVMAYQIAEMNRIDALVKWYQMVYTSLEVSRYFKDPTGNEIGNFGVQSVAVFSLVFADVALLRTWIALVRNPSAFRITPQVVAVANANTRQVLQAAVVRFASAVRNGTIAFAQNSPKLFLPVSTAVVGVIGVAHVGGYYVVNMSEQAYQNLVRSTEAELELLRAMKARLADSRKPFYVP